MEALLGLDLGSLLVILTIITVIGMIVAFLGNFLRVAICLLAVMIATPILFTTLFGDGTTHVQKFASLFPDDTAIQIVEFYEGYQDKKDESGIFVGNSFVDSTVDVIEKTKDSIFGDSSKTD